MTRFRRATIALILLNLAVFAWGALVRATGSGAGCGRHWPTCNGEVVPTAPEVATLIELTHRVTSGLDLLLTAGLVFWATRVFPRGSAGRRSAWASLFLICMEAVIGAILVLAELTGHDASMTRAMVIGFHLLNTYLLLAAYTLTAWWAGEGGTPRLGERAWLVAMFGLAALLLAATGSTGAIAALGDALFPAHDLASALAQDFDGTAHLLVRLRVIHPVIAGLAGIWLLLTAIAAASLGLGRATARAAAVVAGVVVAQVSVGVVNVLLLAPVWIQCLHLVLAELLWIAAIWLALTALSSPVERKPQGN